MAGARKAGTTRARRLKPGELHRQVDPRRFSFETTADLEALEGVIEQERAVEAIATGLAVRKRNFNIYVSGASGTGKSSILKGLLKRVAAQDPVPPDRCLVHNFRHPDRPVVLTLPPGRGVELRDAMDRLFEELKVELPKAFHGKVHQERIQRILNEGLEAENRAFTVLARDAQEVGFLVKSTKDGLVTIPVVDGRPLGPREFSDLSEAQRAQVEAGRQRLEPLISRFLEDTRNTEIAVHRKIQEAQRSLCHVIVTRHLQPVREAFAEFEAVVAHLEAVVAHVLDNLALFLPDETERRQSQKRQPPMTEYRVNVLVDNSETKGAPVLFETTPTYHNLIGKVEKRVEHGIYSTDFTMVKAGALIRAHGGYLVLHARDVLTYPFAWEALKGVLRHQKVEIEEMGEHFQFLPTSGLRPDPIPVQCKVILIGSNHLYHLLTRLDEDFGKTFQVKAEFDSSVRRTPDTTMEYARFVATTCRRDGLRPVDRNGVAAVVEVGSRLAGSSDRITLRFNEIQNLLIEADALAGFEGVDAITRRHIEDAMVQRRRRISLLADRTVEEIVEGTIHVDLEGSRVGAINGLAVFEFADLVFGRPLRITARTYQGKAGVVNVEREARLSGSIHNKGVLVLGGYLGDRFAQTRPLSLTVNLVVEQSYGMIDGDSASCAELCAILSSLADWPVRQDLAVTGSVSQFGEVQAVGGINEKVEGFFRVCLERGLTGTQGVIIPEANVRHLMLDSEVVEAVRARRFHLHAVRTVDEAMGLLTGQSVGERGPDGEYPEDSVFARVAAKLKRFSESSEPKDKNAA